MTARAFSDSDIASAAGKALDQATSSPMVPCARQNPHQPTHGRRFRRTFQRTLPAAPAEGFTIATSCVTLMRVRLEPAIRLLDTGRFPVQLIEFHTQALAKRNVSCQIDVRIQATFVEPDKRIFRCRIQSVHQAIFHPPPLPRPDALFSFRKLPQCTLRNLPYRFIPRVKVKLQKIFRHLPRVDKERRFQPPVVCV